MVTTEQLYKIYLQHPVISTDTRKITAGSIFFALKGDNFDANTFAEQAAATGAAYVVIDNPDYQKDERYLLVVDVLTALQDLARYHRRQINIPVIGLTGSNGKTTTKELINSVLSQRFNTYATQGNLNNHIGVPLTILAIREEHQVAVIEMGANHQKEIEMLCTIAQPSHGMITNIGKAHLEGFGGIEGVKKGKGELYDYLKATYGVAFINSNSHALIEMQQERKLTNVIYYGTDKSRKSITGELVENAPYLKLQWTDEEADETYTVQSQLTGEYNLDNALAAICIGNYFELTAEQINRGVAGYVPQNNRSQIVKTATNTLICDYYNANPSSMVVAIENVATLVTNQNKVLVLGDMFEMGDEAATEHRAIIQKAMAAPVNQRVFIGKDFFTVSEEVGKPESRDEARFFLTAEEAIEAFKQHPIQHSTILIKGSRGMALERLVDLF